MNKRLLLGVFLYIVTELLCVVSLFSSEWISSTHLGKNNFTILLLTWVRIILQYQRCFIIKELGTKKEYCNCTMIYIIEQIFISLSQFFINTIKNFYQSCTSNSIMYSLIYGGFHIEVHTFYHKEGKSIKYLV